MSTGKTQIFSLLCGAGNVVYKNRFFSCRARQGFSSLLVNLVVPAMIVDSYLIPFDPEILANLVRTALASAAALGLGLAFALLVQTIG